MKEQGYPEAVVGVLVLNQEGEIFLMASSKWQGKYCLPGGHIEFGETMEETAKREIKEETGLDIFDIEFLMVQECIFSEEFYKKKHFVFLDHIAKTKDIDAVLDGSEGSEYVWTTVDDALKLSLNPYTKNTILEYKKKYKK